MKPQLVVGYNHWVVVGNTIWSSRKFIAWNNFEVTNE